MVHWRQEYCAGLAVRDQSEKANVSLYRACASVLLYSQNDTNERKQILILRTGLVARKLLPAVRWLMIRQGGKSLTVSPWFRQRISSTPLEQISLRHSARAPSSRIVWTM